MTDLNPPPVDPMDEATRTRVRERILAGAGGAEDHHPWWIPVAAAVAVLAIALGTGWAALRPTADPEPAGPAAPSSPSARPTEAASTRPTDDVSTGPPPSGAPGSGERCERTVGRQLPGAAPAVQQELPAGTAAVWVAGTRSVVCEDSGGVVTTHRVRPLAAPDLLGREELGFSTSTYDLDGRRQLTAYVAGGPLPEDVSGIAYSFPDGHTERAVLRTDDQGRRWWVMGYVPEDGLLADPRTNLLDLDHVRVRVTAGDQVLVEVLRWGADECAQVNHGC